MKSCGEKGFECHPDAIPEGSERHLGGIAKASECHSSAIGDPNALWDTDIRNIGLQLLVGNSGRMENGPDGAANTNVGAYHAPSSHQIEGEVLAILPSTLAGLTDTERRTRIIYLLDDARQRYIAARAARLRLMVLARDNGVSCRDIGIVLGISEQAVRAQIKRIRAGGR